jgi:hypothetical protein
VAPENAFVICVDEKPSIEALERAQGYLKLPNYKRNGTSTLLAAFEVATAKVTAAHKKAPPARRLSRFHERYRRRLPQHGHPRHPRQLQHPQAQNDRWITRHPNVRFYFAPTRAS